MEEGRDIRIKLAKFFYFPPEIQQNVVEEAPRESKMRVRAKELLVRGDAGSTAAMLLRRGFRSVSFFFFHLKKINASTFRPWIPGALVATPLNTLI